MYIYLIFYVKLRLKNHWNEVLKSLCSHIIHTNWWFCYDFLSSSELLGWRHFIFSSPENEVLKVSYFIAFCPAASGNIFSSVTSGSIVMKLHRKHPLNVLTRIPSNFWDSCRILVSMATKHNLKIFLILNWLIDFQIIL